MRAARVFRWIVRIFVLFLTGTMTIVSVLGGLSAVYILNNPANIQIPSGPINLEISSNNTENWYIEVPFTLTNAGYFDLTDLQISFRVRMQNATERQIIFDDDENFGDILHGQTLNDIYNATNFNVDQLIINPSFKVNISISASYSLDLISFNVNLNNIDLGSL